MMCCICTSNEGNITVCYGDMDDNNLINYTYCKVCDECEPVQNIGPKYRMTYFSLYFDIVRCNEPGCDKKLLYHDYDVGIKYYCKEHELDLQCRALRRNMKRCSHYISSSENILCDYHGQYNPLNYSKSKHMDNYQ